MGKNNLLLPRWPKILFLILALCYPVFLLLYKLTSLVRGVSASESNLISASQTAFSNIFSNPVDLPIHILRRMLIKLLPNHQLFGLRFINIVIGLILLISMLYIIKIWYGNRAVIYGFFILSSSAWLLHISRIGSDNIMLLASLPIIFAGLVALDEYPQSWKILFLNLGIWLLLIYSPGIFWFLLINFFFYRHSIAEAFSNLSNKFRVIAGLIIILGLTPLIYGLINQANLNIILAISGLPADLPQWSNLLNNVYHNLIFINFYGVFSSDEWLGHLPLLDIFLSAMFLTGLLFSLSAFPSISNQAFIL